MKNKILFRLILYFVTSFLIFSLVIGIVFSTLFSKHNMDIHKAELETRAVSIADTLSGLFNSGMGHGMGMMGYGMYLRFIDDIAMSDVWIVDRNLEQITFGHGHMSLSYKDLPAGAEQVIVEALDGKTSFSESFSAFLETPTITAATPIIADDGIVVGAVLLHSQISDVNRTTGNGLLILVFSMIAAVFISVFVACALSSHFTKPLGMMKRAALQISGGDYSAKTGVTQADEIGELAVVIDNMAVRLDAASNERTKLEKLRRDFVANVSHELRTPVTVIRGSLEALCDGVVTEPSKVGEYHRQMLYESVYLERLVSDLLDLSRLQNPDFAIDMMMVDLKEIADDAIRGISRIAEQKNVRLHLTSEGEIFTVTGDYGRLRQMLIIILDNAVKFSPDGETVDLALSKDGGRITITIRDKGCGIPPHDLPHVFERFYMQRSEQNKNGTGLGLAIAKQIADRHGVSVTIMSWPGNGAEFLFTFNNMPALEALQ